MVHARLKARPHAALAAVDAHHLCGALVGLRVAEPVAARRQRSLHVLRDASLASAGISRGLVRLSLGYTGRLEDRLEQLERGYRAAMA